MADIIDCRTCGHPTRQANQPSDGITRVRRGDLLCVVCYRAATRPAHMPTTDITPQRHAWNVASHNAYIAGRRRRGIPVDGIKLAAPEPHQTPKRKSIKALLRQLEREQREIHQLTAAKNARDARQAAHGIAS